MKYPLEISTECKKILEESSIHNVSRHPRAKQLKMVIYELTSEFPERINFSKRIKAIARQKECRCVWCNTIFGDPDRSNYCSSMCYLTSKRNSAKTKEQAAIEKAIRRGEKKFVNATEQLDYLVCKICPAKTANLSTHVTVHGITIGDYKKKYKIKTAKTQKQIDDMRSEKNPGYQHNGRFSPWSKNFVRGYDKERHNAAKTAQREFVTKNGHRFKFNLAYWLKETNGDIEQATALYTKFQTRNLEWFIEKYGEVIGRQKHQEKTAKWQQTLNNKSVAELALINSKKVRKSYCFYSKAEKEIFQTLKQIFPELADQLCLCIDETATRKRFYFYDIVLGKKIIEYNGDFWHANPKLFDSTFVNPYNKKPQSAIFEKDKHKMQIARQNGYEVLVVWENDYKQNKELVIEQCIKFLTV